MRNNTNEKNKAKPLYLRYLPYLLFMTMGYWISDLVIIKYRDLMLPSQSPPSRPKKEEHYSLTSRSDFNSIINRNIFNSDEIIPEVVSKDGTGASKEEDLPPVPSSLPLNLIGTIVFTQPEKSIANIEIKGKNLAIPIRVGREIEGIAKLVKVERGKAIIRNLNNGRLEFIEMKLQDGKVAFSGAKNITSTTDAAKNGEVTQLAPNKFEIKRSDLEKYTNNMAAILQQAAVVPHKGPNGELDGFKFVSIQPGSIYTQFGFQVGDVIKSVNGEKVDSPAKGMELFNALKGSASLKMTIERDGRENESEFTIK